MKEKDTMTAKRAFFEYVLGIMGNFYLENAFVTRLTMRSLKEDVSYVYSESLWLFLFSIYPLVRINRKSLAKSKRIFQTKPRIAKLEKKNGKKQKIAGPPTFEEKEALVIEEKENKTEKKHKKTMVVTAAICSGVLNVISKVLFYRSLNHTSFTVASMARVFRLIPVTTIVIPERRSVNVRYKDVLSVLVVTLGVFMCVFSREEKMECPFYLLTLKGNEKYLHLEEKMKIIRSALKFFASFNIPDKEGGEETREEKLFLEHLRGRRRSPQDLLLPVPEQIRLYYRGIVVFYRQGASRKKSPNLQRVCELLLIKGKETEVVTENLVASFLGVICTEKNTQNYKSFIEKSKLDAGVLLTVFSWLNLACETGQIIIMKRYRMNYYYALYGINMCSWAFCHLYMTSFEIDRLFSCDFLSMKVVLAGMISTYSKINMTTEFKTNSPSLEVGTKIGMHFATFFLSVMFYYHDFNSGHCIGLALIFIGSLMNLELYTNIISRWSMRGYLNRKCT